MDAIEYHERLANDSGRRLPLGRFPSSVGVYPKAILPSLPRSGLWLDIGCGAGTFSRELAEGGRRVVGIDGAPSMIGQAVRRAEQARFPSRMSFESQDLDFFHSETASLTAAFASACWNILIIQMD